jgi:hypothetical protein
MIKSSVTNDIHYVYREKGRSKARDLSSSHESGVRIKLGMGLVC